MSEAKTKPTQASVATYLAAIADPERRAGCEAVAKLMRQITGQRPKMWGPGMVGYGSYRYQYDSGHSGEYFKTGFASRKSNLVVYLVVPGAHQDKLLTKLGKHKMAKSCLYIRRMADVDLKVLTSLIANSVAAVERHYR